MAVTSSVPSPFDAAASNPTVQRWLHAAALILAAALTGFGLMMWIAANWAEIGKFGRFGLVGGVIAVAALAAALLPRLRVAASLVGVLAVGGILALFGQTYQSGADPWQLFAIWAALVLPWVIAARHDAVWSLWVIVASVALSLWLYAHTNRFGSPELAAALPAWLGAGVLAYVVSPWSGLDPWLGRTPWSFRLATVLMLLMVTGPTVPAIFGRADVFIMPLVALAISGGTLWLLASSTPRDVMLLSAAVLAIDAILTLAVVRVAANHSHIGSFLLIGLICAGIVGASAMLLISLARDGVSSFRPNAPSSSTSATTDGDTPTWPIAVVSGLGAVMAAIPLLVFLALSFGVALEKGTGTYVMGGLIAAGAVFALISAKPLSFLQQLGFIALTTGLALVTYAVYRDLPSGMASLFLAALAIGLAIVIPASWIRGLLGLAAALFIAMALAIAISRFGQTGTTRANWNWISNVGAFRLAWLITSAAAAGAVLATSPTTRWLPASTVEPSAAFMGGAAAATMLGLIAVAGPTFLLSATLSPHSTQLGTTIGSSTVWEVTRVAGVLLAIGAVVMAWWARPDLGSSMGAATGAVAVILAAFTPTLGAALLLLVAAWLAGRDGLAVLAAFTALWIIGAFYYWLGWPLHQKALLLVALGLGLGAVAWISGQRFPHLPDNVSVNPAMSVLTAIAMIATSALATGAVTGHGIWQKEALIASGRKIFVALAPVDPRSLMQGDFMALRFTLPDLKNAPAADERTDLYALAVVESSGLARMASISQTRPAPSPDQVTFKLTAKKNVWGLGTDAWFFKEGTGITWAKARFGEFRVAPTGEAILVGLADADMKPIK